jgi:hypothetical protein
MFPKSPDISAQKQLVTGLFGRAPGTAGQRFDYSQNQRRARPMFSDYSGWTLRPEFREDLGDRAQSIEQLLRIMGPSMLGSRGKMFYQFMSPPEEPALSQQGNAFADLLSGVFSGGNANTRNAMSAFTGFMSRRK